jgi:hypothetical protein
MVLYYCDLFFELYLSSLYFVITTFRGMALPSSLGEPNLLGPIDRASLYRWTIGVYHRNVIAAYLHHTLVGLQIS